MPILLCQEAFSTTSLSVYSYGSWMNSIMNNAIIFFFLRKSLKNSRALPFYESFTSTNERESYKGNNYDYPNYCYVKESWIQAKDLSLPQVCLIYS